MRDKRTPKDVCGEARVVGVVQFWVESVVVYRLVKVFLLVAPAPKNQLTRTRPDEFFRSPKCMFCGEQKRYKMLLI